MTRPLPRRSAPAALSLRIGAWFEAQATGWAVLAIPLILVLLAGLTVAGWLLTGAPGGSG